MFKSEIFKKGILVLGILLAVVGIVYAAESYRVLAPGGSTQIDEWGICREVVNNNSQDLFVPTRSSQEWSSLVNNGAPNVNLNNCGGGGGGGTCGDAYCDVPSENAGNCPADCGPGSMSCGDGFCDPGENNTCPSDCGGGQVCGDGLCEYPEDEISCSQDCISGS